MTGDARRWQMTEAPVMAPAVDYFTRTPNGPFLDTGVEVNFGMKGHIYISRETLREMAEIAGILESTDAAQQQLHEEAIYNRGLKDGLNQGEDLRERLQQLQQHLGLGGFDLGAGGDPAGADPAGGVPPVVEQPASGEDGGDPVDAAVGGGEPGGAPDDDARGEGADGVSGDGDDGNSAFRI